MNELEQKHYNILVEQIKLFAKIGDLYRQLGERVASRTDLSKTEKSIVDRIKEIQRELKQLNIEEIEMGEKINKLNKE